MQEDSSFLACYAVLIDNSLLTSQKIVMSSSSGSVSWVVLGKLQSSVSQICDSWC